MTIATDNTQSPTPIWTARLEQPAKQTPILVDNCLFVPMQSASRGAQHSDLVALDIQTGTVLWQHHFEYALISGLQAYWLPNRQATVGVVTTHSSDLLRGTGDVFAFSANGEQIWQWQDTEKSYSAPVVQDLQLVVLAGDSTLAVVSPEAEGDDDVVRIPLTVSTALAAPAVVDQIAYIPCRAAELVAVDLTGALRWHFRVPDKPHAWLDFSPVLSGELLFCVSRAGSVYALNTATGQLLWQAEVGDKRPLSPPVVAGNSVLVGSRSGLVALNQQNGQVNWHFSTQRPISAAPISNQETLYVGCEDHNLYALNLANGAEQWRYGLPGRIEISPVAIEGALLVCDRSGNLVALPLPELLAAQQTESLDLTAAEPKPKNSLEEPSSIAQTWLASGDLEKAAQAFEEEDSWLQAAEVWQQLDRYGKRADALEKHANTLENLAVDEEEKAAAWAQAARAHAEIGQKEARLRCERQAARHRRQPILSVEIKPEPMVQNAWSKLDFTINNDGFGPALHVVVNVVDDRFEGQAMHTQTLTTILPKRSYSHWLDILPKAVGSNVPMRLAIEYGDRVGNVHHLERRFYLTVVGKAETASSQFIAGDSQSFARLQAPDGRDLAVLRQKMINAFSKEELYNVLFDFGLRADDFGDRLSTIARELITYAVQTEQLDELIDMCRRHHPFVDW